MKYLFIVLAAFTLSSGTFAQVQGEKNDRVNAELEKARFAGQLKSIEFMVSPNNCTTAVVTQINVGSNGTVFFKVSNSDSEYSVQNGPPAMKILNVLLASYTHRVPICFEPHVKNDIIGGVLLKRR